MLRSPGPTLLSARPDRSGARPGVTALVAVVAALAVVLGVPTSASAHDVLLEASPADGAVLDAPPAEIALTFSADQVEIGAAIVVTDASGTAWGEGDAVVDGPVVRQALPADLPAGAYHVAWRSVSSDGHALNGETTFEVTAPAVPVDEESPSPEPSAEPTETADPADVTPSPSPSTEDDVVAGAGDSDGGGGAPVWLFVVIGVLVIGGVAVVLLRRDRSSES